MLKYSLIPMIIAPLLCADATTSNLEKLATALKELNVKPKHADGPTPKKNPKISDILKDPHLYASAPGAIDKACNAILSDPLNYLDKPEAFNEPWITKIQDHAAAHRLGTEYGNYQAAKSEYLRIKAESYKPKG